MEKLLKDNGDKLPADVKSEIEADVDALKKALEGDDDAAVKAAFEKLNENQSKIGQALYEAAQAEAAAGEQPAADEDVVDAEVIDEDEKK